MNETLAALVSRLGPEAGTLTFSLAVDALARAGGDPRPVGTTGPVEDETILFRATPSMGFPGADVTAITARPDSADSGWPVHMDVSFLGLYGPSSPLPAFWTERIVQDQEGAANLRDFLDVFNHPLIALLHRISHHHRIDQQFDRTLDQAAPRAIMALTGQIAGSALARVLDWTRLLPVAGLLAHSARSSQQVTEIIAGYFEVPVTIEEWVPRMVAIPSDQMFTLGSPEAALGSGTVLGESVPDVMGAIRVVLGPLTRPDFESFLPDGVRRAELRALLGAILQRPMLCLVDLLMDAEAAGGLVLGEGRLGWTTWQSGGDEAPRCPTGPV